MKTLLCNIQPVERNLPLDWLLCAAVIMLSRVFQQHVQSVILNGLYLPAVANKSTESRCYKCALSC